MKNKMFSLLLILLILVNTTLVYAEDWELTESTNAETTVYATVTDDFSVKIPKTLTLSEGGNNLPIQSKGDISLDRQVRVECPEYVTLTNQRNNEFKVTLQIVNHSLAWLEEELTLDDYIQKEMSIDFSESKLEAGDYVGTIAYDIVLEIQPTQLSANWKSLITDYSNIQSTATTLIFQDGYPSTEGATATYDLSEAQDGGILGVWNATTKTFTIGSPLRIVAPASLNFYNWSALVDIDFTNLDTSNTTNMGSLFQSCSSLVDLDLTSFDVSNVTEFGNSFAFTTKLKNLDLTGWNTESAVSMTSMFHSCSSLRSVDGLDDFNTSNVTSMENMFNRFSSYMAPDVSKWDTSKVTSMRAMFQFWCYNDDVDLTGLDTENVVDFSVMFSGCQAKSLDLSTWDTTSAEQMVFMFANMANLTKLDISNFETPYLKYANYIFAWDSALTEVDMRNINWSRVVSPVPESVCKDTTLTSNTDSRCVINNWSTLSSIKYYVNSTWEAAVNSGRTGYSSGTFVEIQ